MICSKPAEPIKMLFGLRTLVGPRKSSRLIPDPPWEGAIFRGEMGHPLQSVATRLRALQKWLNWSICHFDLDLDLDFAPPIPVFLLGLIGVLQIGFVFVFWVSPVKRVLGGHAHWRHLANTIEPSVCGGDAVLCQITLTTWYGTGVREPVYSLFHQESGSGWRTMRSGHWLGSVHYDSFSAYDRKDILHVKTAFATYDVLLQNQQRKKTEGD